MRLSFDSIEEVKEFVKSLKGTRGGRNEPDEAPAMAGTAPAPLATPATTSFPASGFAPQAQPAAFPGASGAPAVAPEVLALVQRITSKLDAAIAAGTANLEQALPWFRSQCGAEAANATIDQIKAQFLPKLTVPALDNIAKMMAA